MKFTIGTANSKPVKADALVLADTRALINASSGLGKSWLLRLIAENVAPWVQTIILDPEGEFATLREKLDILIVSENGDLKPDVRSAKLLARKLAETGVSAVIDLYELPGKADPWEKRRMFVAAFLGELMNLPKKMWHPLLVIVDEAHQFAPEGTSGKSAVPLAMCRSAIRNLMSAGRKRGFGGILATQRLSKIDKDAIADVRNWLIGGTALDIDRQRAADILGMTKAESVVLRDLDPGTFFAFGPAIEGKGIVQFISGAVKTSHPTAGKHTSIVVPKASTQLAGILEKFGDLPAIAEEEIRTLETLKRENADLRRQLREHPKEMVPEVRVERVEIPVFQNGEVSALQRAVDGIHAALRKAEQEAVAQLQPIPETEYNIEFYPPSPPVQTSPRIVNHAPRQAGKATATKAVAEGITGPMQRILDAIAWFEGIGINQPNQTAVAFLAGYTVGGGAFNNPRGKLNTSGLVRYVTGGRIELTNAGRYVANYPDTPLTTQKLHEHVMAILKGPERKILKALLDNYERGEMPKETCADLAGYTTGGGAFNNPLGRLRSMGLVEYPQPGWVKASSLLFLEQAGS